MDAENCEVLSKREKTTFFIFIIISKKSFLLKLKSLIIYSDNWNHQKEKW
jgi:hypothetical protein